MYIGSTTSLANGHRATLCDAPVLQRGESDDTDDIDADVQIVVCDALWSSEWILVNYSERKEGGLFAKEDQGNDAHDVIADATVILAIKCELSALDIT